MIQDQRSTLWLWELCAESEECRRAEGEDNVCLQTKIAGDLRCKYSPSSSSPLTVPWWPLTSPLLDEAVHRQLMTSCAWCPLVLPLDWRGGEKLSAVPLWPHTAGQCLVFLKALWWELNWRGTSIQQVWVWRLLWIQIISQVHILSTSFGASSRG